jgi:hypothetical protein
MSDATHLPCAWQWQDRRFDISRLIDTEDSRIIARVCKESATGDTDWEQWVATIYPFSGIELKCISIGQFESRDKAKAAVDAAVAKCAGYES